MADAERDYQRRQADAENEHQRRLADDQRKYVLDLRRSAYAGFVETLFLAVDYLVTGPIFSGGAAAAAHARELLGAARSARLQASVVASPEFDQIAHDAIDELIDLEYDIEPHKLRAWVKATPYVFARKCVDQGRRELIGE